MTKPLKNYTVAFAFAASLLGLIPFPAAANPSTEILQMRADGPYSSLRKRLKAPVLEVIVQSITVCSGYVAVIATDHVVRDL